MRGNRTVRLQCNHARKSAARHTSSTREVMANNDKGRVFGHILGATVGQIFKDRAVLAKAGIHKPNQAGISGSGIFNTGTRKEVEAIATSFGRKIQKAIELIDGEHPLIILTEQEWVKFI